MKKISLILIFMCMFSPQSSAEQVKKIIRFGVVAYGTANWELTVIETERIADQHHFRLDIRSLASPQAGKIALQSGAVDIIVSDWIWVSRQRTRGADFVFVPYSNSAGALVVPKDSEIQTINDLNGKRFGIAGGGLDKNWLLLRALAQKQEGLDLDSSVEKVFAAPPLLNNQMHQGNLDALINYWHYAARLEAAGYKQLMDGHDILRGLDIKERVPSLGFVFKESWANSDRSLVSRFLSASIEAKDLLCRDDSTWKTIVPLIRVPDTATQTLLRSRYCDGRIRSWGDKEKRAAQQVFELLYRFGGEKLTGKSTQLDKGTFWEYQLSPS